MPTVSEVRHNRQIITLSTTANQNSQRERILTVEVIGIQG